MRPNACNRSLISGLVFAVCDRRPVAISSADTFVVRIFGTFFRTKCNFIMGPPLTAVNVLEGVLFYSSFRENILEGLYE